MSDHIREPRWSDYAAKIAGLLVFGATLWGQAPDALGGTSVQDGLNLVLAKALVLGEGFHLIHIPDGPAAHGMAPLYPWLVSVLGRVWRFFPENLLLMQITSSAMLGAAAWIIASSLQRVCAVSPWLVAAATVVGFVNVPVASMATVPVAEPLALLCLAGAVGVATAEPPRPWAGAGVGLMAGAATLASVAVTPAAIGVGLGLAIQRRFRAAGSAVAVTTAVFVMWWFAWGTGPASSVDIGGLRVLTVGNPLVAVRTFFLSHPASIALLLFGALLGFAVWGTAVHWKKGSAFVFVGLGLGLSAWLWPSASPRLWSLTLPWICSLAGLGAAALWARFPQARFTVGAAAIVFVAMVLPRNVLGVIRQFPQELDEATQPVRYLLSTTIAELPADAIVSTDVAALVYLYTERRTIPWWIGSPGETAHRDVQSECVRGVTHVAVSGLPTGMEGRFEELTTSVHLSPVFELADGPSLYELQCSD